jgi:FkbM family methyltransferase
MTPPPSAWKRHLDRAIGHVRWNISTARRLFVWRAALGPWVPSRLERARLAALILGLIARLARIKVPLVSFELVIEGRHHRVRVANHHELAGAVEVLCTDDYDVAIAPADVRKVLDLGANAGFATLLFASRYPIAQIVALEPAPDTYVRLQQNVGHLPNVTLMPFAAGEPGSIVIDLRTPSTERQGGQDSAGGHEVRRLGLDELLERLAWDEVDVLKIDIEGDEFALLADPTIERARVIVGELHARAAPAGFIELQSWLPRFDVVHSPLDGLDFVMFRAVRRDSTLEI